MKAKLNGAPGKTKPVKILVCDPLEDEGIAILSKEGGFEVAEAIKLAVPELKKAIRDAQAVIVRSGTKLTGDIIREGKSLKIIGRAGVGLDNVDVEAASKHGVVVVNTPEGNTISAAEHAFSLLLSLARNIPQAHASMGRGEWERKKFTGVELYEKSLGLIGLGRIGSEVAKRAQSFGMQVMAYDPYLREENAVKLGVKLVTLDALYAASDFISLHVPLNEDTRNIICQASIAKMKDGVRIINCARGGLIHDGDLQKALQHGKIAGAAMDVFEEEPPKAASWFLNHPKVIVTPHLGASTGEAQRKVALDIARTVVDYLAGRGLRNAVNMPSVDPELLKELEPYIRLSEKIGSLQTQLADGQILQVGIRYHGRLAERPSAPMTHALLKGLLTPLLGDGVNYVNAPHLAKDRGIRIIEAKSQDPSVFENLIEVEVKTRKEKRSISGTVYNGHDARIVRFDQMRIDCIPQGYILLMAHRDVPGIVGKIGTLLARYRINIADMTLGRDKPGGIAKTLVSIDSCVADPVLKKIRATQNILDAKLVKL